MAKNIQMKRIYDDVSEDDGRRVLVDRVWPRGVSKEKAQLDEWLKDAAPTPDLRKWFGHKPERFQTFKSRYKEQLKQTDKRQESVDKLKDWAQEGPVTLLYAAKDEEHNHVVVLTEVLEEE